jgi:hypothetical protein
MIETSGSRRKWRTMKVRNVFLVDPNVDTHSFVFVESRIHHQRMVLFYLLI